MKYACSIIYRCVFRSAERHCWVSSALPKSVDGVLHATTKAFVPPNEVGNGVFGCGFQLIWLS